MSMKTIEIKSSVVLVRGIQLASSNYDKWLRGKYNIAYSGYTFFKTQINKLKFIPTNESSYLLALTNDAGFCCIDDLGVNFSQHFTTADGRELVIKPANTWEEKLRYINEFIAEITEEENAPEITDASEMFF